MDSVVKELKSLPDLRELYEVSGEYDIVSVVSAKDMDEFRDILVNRIMKIKGVRSTVTDVVLYSHKASIREDESHRRQTHAKTGESR